MSLSWEKFLCHSGEFSPFAEATISDLLAHIRCYLMTFDI